MKKIVLAISTVLWSVSAMANTNQTILATETDSGAVQQAPASGLINIVTRPEIMGLWGMEIPTSKQCVEYYNFRQDNGVVIKSADEWSLGQYQYQVPSNRSEQLPALVMQIKYDNNEKDCSGNQVDQTGEVQQFFVKWINQQQIQFCANHNGENCFATLHRSLP